MFRPHLDVFKDVFGLPDQNKNEGDTKLSVIIWCQILIGSLQRHIAAIFAGNPCRGGPVDKIRNFEEETTCQ